MTPTLTDEQVEAYVRKIAAEEAAKSGTKPDDTTDNTPAPITLNIAGKEMTFKDSNEASSVLTSVYEQQRTAQAQPQNQGRSVTSDADTNAWTPEDQSRYVDMLVKNPILAQEYIDEKRFGVKNPTELIKQNMAATQAMATQLTIDRFVSEHKDYHVSPENAQAMQTVLTELGGGRAVINPMALEAAYAIADKRGLLKKPQEQQNSQAAYNPYLAAPPAAGRNSSQTSPSFANDAESMSTEAIEALFARMQ